MNRIITIGRQYGSSGHEVGRRLAAKLGVRCVDKELITLAAEKSGMSEETLMHVDEKAASSLLYTLVMGSNMYHSAIDRFNVPINDKLFCLQADIIREIAEQESCVIVGRCADYILAEHPGLVKVFIYSSFEARVQQILTRPTTTGETITEAQARDLIMKTDKRRQYYYNYYTGNKWGKAENYDISLSTEKIGVDGAEEVLAAYIAALPPLDG